MGTTFVETELERARQQAEDGARAAEAAAERARLSRLRCELLEQLLEVEQAIAAVDGRHVDDAPATQFPGNGDVFHAGGDPHRDGAFGSLS